MARTSHATPIGCSKCRGSTSCWSRRLSRFPGRLMRLDGLQRELARADLVIDAVFGVGLSRAPEGPAAAAIEACAASSVPILAVDVPSGVGADTGAVPGAVVDARATVTFT